MGVTGLVRWLSAPPTTALDLIGKHVCHNYGGTPRGKYTVHVRSYREHLPSPPSSAPSAAAPPKVLYTVHFPATLGQQDTLHVLVEDPAAQQAHARLTLVSVAAREFELTLAKTRRWVPRPGGVVVDGIELAVGPDWVLRAGNVMLGQGKTRGVVIEAEYLPLPNLPPSSPLLSAFLASILPQQSEGQTTLVSISDAQWAGIGLGEGGDWVGRERGRRTAFEVIGFLKGEGLI